MSPRNAIIFSFLLLLTVNVVLLDLLVFSPAYRQSEAVSVAVPSPSTACPGSCQTLIKDTFETQKISDISIPIETSSVQSASAGPKEYYIPLGSGSTRLTDYQDLTSVEAYVDTANYPSIKQAYFEVHLRNTTGNGAVIAKLFNVTDKHDVWFSEVSFIGGGTGLRESKISLDKGNKLYRVMMKATLFYDVHVDNARIRILTQ